MAETTADRTVFNPLTSGRDAYKPDNYKPALRRAILKLQGFNPETYKLSRFQLHHVVLTSILQPFLQGRGVEDQARIIKAVEESLGTKLVNNIENLIPMAKELHIKGFGAVHKLIQEITDLQGRPLGEVDIPGKSFQKGAKVSTSLENIAKYSALPEKELIDTLSGWVKLVQPELQKQALVSAALTGERKGRAFLTYLVNTIPNAQELLKQGIEEQLGQNNAVLEQFGLKKKLSGTDKKIISKIKNLNRQINQYNNLGPVKLVSEMNADELYNFRKTQTVMDVYNEVGKGIIKPGKSEAELARRLKTITSTYPGGAGKGFADTTGIFQFTDAGGGTAALTDRTGLSLYGNDLYKTLTNVADKGDQIVSGVSDSMKLKKVQQMASLSDFSGAVKLGSLIPLLGLGFDYLDMDQREQYIKDKIERVPGYEGSESHQKDVAQWRVSQGTVGAGVAGLTVAPAAGQATNFATGIGNLTTDIYRTFTEEDKRQEAIDSIKNLSALFGTSPGRSYKPGSKGMEYEERRQETAETTIKGSEMFEPRESTEDTEEGVEIKPWNAYQLLKF